MHDVVTLSLVNTSTGPSATSSAKDIRDTSHLAKLLPVLGSTHVLYSMVGRVVYPVPHKKVLTRQVKLQLHFFVGNNYRKVLLGISESNNNSLCIKRGELEFKMSSKQLNASGKFVVQYIEVCLSIVYIFNFFSFFLFL